MIPTGIHVFWWVLWHCFNAAHLLHNAMQIEYSILMCHCTDTVDACVFPPGHAQRCNKPLRRFPVHSDYMTASHVFNCRKTLHSKGIGLKEKPYDNAFLTAMLALREALNKRKLMKKPHIIIFHMCLYSSAGSVCSVFVVGIPHTWKLRAMTLWIHFCHSTFHIPDEAPRTAEITKEKMP